MPRSSIPAVIHRTTGRLLRIAERRVSGVIAKIAGSPAEEDFFRTGDAMSKSQAKTEPHDFSDLDEGFQRPTLWRALKGWLRGERTQHPE